MPNLFGLIVGILIVLLVWVLCAAVGLPYLVALIVTLLAAIIVLSNVAGRTRL